MKLKVRELQKIIKEEITRELNEQELINEGWGKTLAKFLLGAALSMGAEKVADADPVKVKILNVNTDKEVEIDMDDQNMDHHQLKMEIDRDLTKRYGAGRFVVTGVKPGGTGGGEVTPERPAGPSVAKVAKKGAAEVLSVEGDVVTVKVPNSDKDGMSTAYRMAVQKLKSSGDSFSGNASLVSRTAQGDSTIYKVRVK